MLTRPLAALYITEHINQPTHYGRHWRMSSVDVAQWQYIAVLCATHLDLSARREERYSESLPHLSIMNSVHTPECK